MASNIEVLGAVEEPGFYDLKQYSNLRDLIARLNFVDVYPWLAVLEQFDQENLVKSSTLFSINDPSTYESIELLPNSRIYFANIFEMSFEVSQISQKLIEDYQLILNYKNESFELPVYGKYSVKSFVDFLGIDMSDVETFATYVNPLEDIVISDNYLNMQFFAKKYNTVTFKSPMNNLISVTVEGAVEFPGTYTLSDDSTVEDLYKLVGEFKSQALLEGIILTEKLLEKDK